MSDIETQAAPSNAKVAHSKNRTRPSADKDLPKFFPSDMTEDQVAVFKETAAEKRQNKRDEKREDTNPDRTQEEENKERERKTEQSRSNGKNTDPYNGDDEYGRKREAKRVARCERDGVGCDYSTANQECYQDCTDEGYNNVSGRTCSEYCKYMDARCYDDCRNDGDGVVRCLDDCGENIDGNTGRAADRIDCAEDCLDSG